MCDHFVSAAKRKLRPDEFPTLGLPVRSHVTITKPRKPPTVRAILEPPSESSSEEESLAEPNTKVNVGMQASDGSQQEIKELKGTIIQLKAELVASKFCIENVSKDDQ